MKHYTIGQLAKLTDNTVVTIRYYEKLGLLGDIERSAGGFRLYPESLIPLFHFIKNAKYVGFELTEIKQLLELQKDLETSMVIKTKTQDKIKQIDYKIETLTKMKKVLSRWEQACDGQLPVEQCPILNNLYESSIDEG